MMRYTYADLLALYRLQNVQEYVLAVTEVWSGANDEQKADIQADLNELLQQAGRHIEETLYEQLPAELKTGKTPYVPPTPSVGSVLGLFAGEMNGTSHGSSRRFRVTKDVTEPDPQCSPFETVFENAVAAAVDCVNRHGVYVEPDPFVWKVVRVNEQQTTLRLRMDALLSSGRNTPPYEGASVGLALGIAAFSRLTNVEIPTDIASTGILHRTGFVSGITGTQDKVRSLLIEHPYVKRILVANDSDIVDIPTERQGDVKLFDRIESLDQALDIVFEGQGGAQGVAQAFARETDYLRLECKSIVANGRKYRLLQLTDQGGLDPAVLPFLHRHHRTLRTFTQGHPVLIDGARPNWLNLYLGSLLKTWATHIAVHQGDKAIVVWEAEAGTGGERVLGTQFPWDISPE